MNLDKQSIDLATEAALECALWTGLKYHPTDENAEPVQLDTAGYGMDDFTQEARNTMRSLILSFTRSTISELCLNIDTIPADTFGHDFVLTAQRHGAGFWDRGYGVLGDELTRFAHTYTVDVYVTRLDNLGIEPGGIYRAADCIKSYKTRGGADKAASKLYDADRNSDVVAREYFL